MTTPIRRALAIEQDTTALLKKARRIEMRARRAMESAISGDNISIHKGRGMSLAEVRPYTYGDDVRFIDWNVTARHHSPYVKIFHEEKELTLLLIVDVSASNWLANNSMSRAEYIAEIAAVLALSAMQSNDLAGCLLYTDKIEQFIPPARGRNQAIRIIREIVKNEPESHHSTRLSRALDLARRQLRHASRIVIISDFEDTEYENALRRLATRHEITGICVNENELNALPDVGLMPVEDIETGELQWVNTGAEAWRREQRRVREDQLAYFRQAFTQAACEMITLDAGAPYISTLRRLGSRRP